MSDTNEARPSAARWAAASTLAAVSSLGAGAVHAAAIGAHNEHPQVVTVFTALAVAQLAWGALALVRPSRWASVLGIVVGGAAVVGWIMAKTSGISFVDGLETAEPVQWSDGLCAALAAVSVLAAGLHLLAPGTRSADAPARSSVGLQRGAFVAALVVAVLSFTGMNAAASHSHAGSDHDHAGAAAHDHADGADHTDHTDGAGSDAGDGGSTHDHGGSPAVAPVPYDPTKPIDLGGVEGVTPEQQARAENLIAITLARLPQFADYTTLESKGYYSIQDQMTGHEHYINWDYINDGRELDPDHPESLVFEMIDGKKTLVSAMFMAEGGVDLDHVPDIGGALTQWHIHDNLCYTEANPPRVAGLTDANGNCRPGTRTLGTPVPMIHVWIRAHKCGPFAALDGVGAGQVKEGETTLCDTAHGHQH